MDKLTHQLQELAVSISRENITEYASFLPFFLSDIMSPTRLMFDSE